MAVYHKGSLARLINIGNNAVVGGPNVPAGALLGSWPAKTM